jgi:hypothetical protein
MKLTEWLTNNGYAYSAYPLDDTLIQLDGDWISPHQYEVFVSDADIEAAPNADPEVSGAYKITDSQHGTYRLEEFAGNGANGMIADWQEWVESHDLSRLSYAQAVALVGAETVKAVADEQCDYSGRLMSDNSERVEFTASVPCLDASEYIALTAYFYQPQEDLDSCTDGDLGNLTWNVDHYGLSI